jgi:hypothetical protein
VETGVGEARTLAALDWLQSGSPLDAATIVSAGFAGSLQDSLRVGEVIVSRDVMDSSGRVWPTSATNEGPRLLTLSQMLGDPVEKRALGIRHEAGAVDMESAAIARFCAEKHLPFLSVRAISDDLSMALSPSIVRLLGGPRTSIPALLLTVLREPSLVCQLWRLARNTSLAARNLAEVLEQLVMAGRVGGRESPGSN